ncbi:MAG TPA: GTP-binding protein [Pseudonocardia sp.]|nr:GTP-binding protein [Pseudonocardia sp.]
MLVLAGFLGSGKTTLLNHLLANSLDLRIGVIVNDFGSVGVDAMLVGGQADGVVSMGNGCLCCAVEEGGVGPMLDRLARRRAGVDVIVIEASGIAEPGVLVQLVLSCENPRITFGGLVEVVDAAEFERTRARHTELDRHVGLADLVVVNKADRVASAALERVQDLCRAVNGRAPIVVTSHCVVDPRLLFDISVVTGRQLMLGQTNDADPEQPGPAEDPDHSRYSDHSSHPGHSDHSDHMHASYDAVSFVTDQPVDPRRLVEFLSERPEGAYRIKGFVNFGVTGYRQRFVLHAVGRYLRFSRSPWPPGQSRHTALEIIGSGLDRSALGRALGACVRPEPADGDAMLAVIRYTF